MAFGMYFWVAVALAAAGLVDSIYLSVSHYRNYVDIGYSSFCAISRAINCDTVSQSPYAIFLGMPVPVWGVIGYIFVLLLIYFAGMKAACKRRYLGFADSRLSALQYLQHHLSGYFSLLYSQLLHHVHPQLWHQFHVVILLLAGPAPIRPRSLSNILDVGFQIPLASSANVWFDAGTFVCRNCFAVDLISDLLGRSTVRDIGGVRDGFDSGRLPLDRIRKCGPRHYRVYRLYVLSVQQNALLPAQIDEPVPRKNKNYSSSFPYGFTLQSNRQNSISRGFWNVVALGHLCRG